MKNYILYLDRPAESWDNGTPVGCGYSGMMISGGVSRDTLTLNEESVWDGEPTPQAEEGFAEKIVWARKLFLENKDAEANRYIEENLGSAYRRIKSYEYAGVLTLHLHGDDDCADYRRDLDLINGVATVSYRKDGVSYKREYFASYQSELLCTRLTADAPFSCAIGYEHRATDSVTVSEDGFTAVAHTEFTENPFKVCARINTDGAVSASDKLEIKNATYIEIYVRIFTAFKGNMDAAPDFEVSWDGLYNGHTAKHGALMRRSDIDFGEDVLSDLPVNERLERLRDYPDATDAGLIALYWQFGKYLLIGCSRPGTLPANLQGIWVKGARNPWNADYHTNINLQMNYWQAEQANIAECVNPLFDYMNNYLLPAGKRAAKGLYGTKGMVVHHLSDVYGFARAADGPWGLWPMGGAWLAYHMWEHYLYSTDKDFLREVAYEYIKECVRFAEENLFEGRDGHLHTGPSMSPENPFYVEENGKKKKIYITVSPTMDVQIVGGLFDLYRECEKLLSIDPPYAKLIKEKRARLLPMRVGRHGQLMEWRCDYEEAEPGHRHVSHAFGLYPGAQITRQTPELLDALTVTFRRRLSSGGGHTGWSRAWLINLFARLRDGEAAHENIRALFTNSTLDNLLDTHPPFQIDGNFGGAAGIGEMLLQSHEGLLSLLPALPECLQDGSFTGLRARGGLTVDAEWKSGRITALTVTSKRPTKVKIELPEEDVFEAQINGKTVIK